jgi:hypothetical protein
MMTRLKVLLEGVGATFLYTLREIFDENAYDRFLARTGDVPSRASYQAFCEEKRAGDAQRVRCC